MRWSNSIAETTALSLQELNRAVNNRVFWCTLIRGISMSRRHLTLTDILQVPEIKGGGGILTALLCESLLGSKPC